MTILSNIEKQEMYENHKGESLADLFPDLAEQWGENGDLSPYMVSPYSKKKVWWKLLHCDPKTNRTFTFIWDSSIYSRTKGGLGCPYLSNQKIWIGYNDLCTTHPKLVREWNYEKNGKLCPENFVAGSVQKVWWLLPYDDPKTGKHFDFEWEATILSRVQGAGCPYLANRSVYKGYNDLATTNPSLAEEWHPEKNGNLTPSDICEGSSKKVWWLLPYDDPKTGKHFEFEWEAKVVERSNGGGCPFISGKKVWRGYNDLESLNPALASDWNYEKNGGLLPSEVTIFSGKKVWWKCRMGHDWEAQISSRSTGTGCPYCNGESQTSFPEQILFYYFHKYYPDTISRTKISNMEIDVWVPSLRIALEYDGAEWHRANEEKDTLKSKMLEGIGVHLIRIREHGLNPIPGCENYIFPKVDRQYYFLEDVIFELLTPQIKSIKRNDINIDRDRHEILDFALSKQKDNSLKSVFPDISLEWDSEKNIVSPEMFPPYSNHTVWWLCSNGHSYKARICNRTISRTGCPYCSGQKILKGFNDLQTTHPNLIKEWHPSRNTIQPDEVGAFSGKKVWWYFPYDDPETGKHFNFEWEAQIRSRVNGVGCPFLSGKKVWRGFNDLATKHPELIKQWHPTKNGVITPFDVTSGSSMNVWWIFQYDDANTGKHFEFEWQAPVYSRVSGNGIPYLTNKLIWPGYNDLATTHPHIACDWYYEKNGDITPQKVSAKNGKKVWWKCHKCGEICETKVYNRTNYGGCTKCKKGRESD